MHAHRAPSARVSDFVQKPSYRRVAVEIGGQPWRMKSGGQNRRHAVCSKAPGPFDPAAVFNLLAITCWITFVLCPLAAWVLDLA